MQQIAVLGRHLQTPGPAHPHHVSTQVGEHHPGMWAGVDAPQLDDLHRTLEHESRQRHHRVDGQLELYPGLVALRRQEVAPLLGTLLARTDE